MTVDVPGKGTVRALRILSLELCVVKKIGRTAMIWGRQLDKKSYEFIRIEEEQTHINGALTQR